MIPQIGQRWSYNNHTGQKFIAEIVKIDVTHHCKIVQNLSLKPWWSVGEECTSGTMSDDYWTYLEGQDAPPARHLDARSNGG